LKLYRVPTATTVASRQSKQVRLLDRSAIPIETIYGAELSSSNPAGPQPASRLLRTKNNDASHLGLPLPSGRVAVFLRRGGERLLAHESDIRDLAIDEEVEIGMGSAPDIQVTTTQDVDSYRVEIANARSEAIPFELTLRFRDDRVHLAHADRIVGIKNGRPLFRFAVAPNATVIVHYQTTKSGAGTAGRSPRN
jgi:hypothetical protein